jgi:hypothetical protein
MLVGDGAAAHLAANDTARGLPPTAVSRTRTSLKATPRSRQTGSVAIVRSLLLAAASVLSSAIFVAAASAEAGPRFSAPVFNRADADDIVAAEFTGDGNPDLAALGEAGVLSLLAGMGDGTFRRPIALGVVPARRWPADMTAADVNGDGYVDLVASSRNHRGSVSVFLNDGRGRFHLDQVYPSGDAVWAVVVADFNGDGLVDIVATHREVLDLSVLLGTGAGRFGAALQFTGAGAFELAAGDLNHDGKLDLVIVSQGKQMVAVRLGNGDGTFGPERMFGERTPEDLRIDAGEGDASNVALADVNEDGTLDLLLPQDQPYFSRRVSVFLGRGDGTFGAPSVYSMSSQPWDVAIADFDGDGHTDIATAGSGSRLAVRVGRGDGTFDRVRFFPADGWGDLQVADFNRDSRPDLASTQLVGTEVFLNWTGVPAQPCVVRSLVRVRLRVAEHDIRQAGCRIGHVRYRYSRKVGEGRVISQRPRYGTLLPRGSRIDVVVSRGRRP